LAPGVPVRQAVQPFLAVAGDVEVVAFLGQEAGDHLLVEVVVFHQQDSQPAGVLG